MLSLTLNLPALRAWAAAKDPNEWIGAAGCSGGCPVAYFLREQGYQNPHVTNYYVTYTIGDDPVLMDEKLPAQVRDLTKAIDKRYRFSSLSAAQFIAVLDEVEGEYYARLSA